MKILLPYNCQKWLCRHILCIKCVSLIVQVIKDLSLWFGWPRPRHVKRIPAHNVMTTVDRRTQFILRQMK